MRDYMLQKLGESAPFVHVYNLGFFVIFTAVALHSEHRRPLAYDKRNICSFRVAILRSGII